MRGYRWIAALLVVAAGGWALVGVYTGNPTGPGPLKSFTLEGRPQDDRYLFDYARHLEHYEEGAHEYLTRIAKRFHIEAVLVSLPDLGSSNSIGELAADIINRWKIGYGYEGRGLLLLLVNEEREVKLEIAYELEDVYTDAFTGYIEDLQLRPYYLDDDVATGLIAVLEELENRAQIKHQGNYTPGLISRLDEGLLAGGAGAKRRLSDYRDNAEGGRTKGATGNTKKGAASADEAWRIMLAKWAGTGAGMDVDIYTEMTKMAMGDQNNPDPRTRAALGHWEKAHYQVLEDGEHAAIYFGDVEGWDNAPFLFCRTESGWKFDIVHQRRLVVMGPNPTWMVAQGNYPYVHLLSDARQSTGKDLPLSGTDLYSCARDGQIAADIRSLEAASQEDQSDYDSIMALARLNVITGRRPNHVVPLLKLAKKLNRADAEPFKYSAIYNVNTFLQYETALKNVDQYIERRPYDVFGYNILGFVRYRLGRYQDSIDALERAVEVNSDNAYAYALMARNYTLMHENALDLDPRKTGYREDALTMLKNAESVPTPDRRRIAWLRSWLHQRGIL